MQYLDDFNLNSSKEMKLVFFMDAIQHVSRYVCVCVYIIMFVCVHVCVNVILHVYTLYFDDQVSNSFAW